MQSEHFRYSCNHEIKSWENQQGLLLPSEEASDKAFELVGKKPAGGSREIWYKVTNKESN